MNIKKEIIYLLLLILIFSYNRLDAQNLFTLLKKEESGVDFKNTVLDTKYWNILSYEYYYNGGGVGIGDINNDGLSDIFMTANASDCKLYLNQGNLKFLDITKKSGLNNILGYQSGVTMIDINQDGWLDIYLCRTALTEGELRVNSLYINNKNNSFTDRAKEYGLADSSFSTQAYFRDFDLDGDLDLYLLNHPRKMSEARTLILTKDNLGKLGVKSPNSYTNYSDRYYENINGKYVDKTKFAGIENYAFGLSALVADFNNDLYPDVYVANDLMMPDFLYINNKNGTFTEQIDSFFSHLSFNSMGTDYADLDNDGFEELIVLDMVPENVFRVKQFKQQINYDEYEKYLKYNLKSQFIKNVVQRREKNKKFSDISHALGMTNTDWSWTPMIADFDNNGLKDVFITNGYNRDITNLDASKFLIDSIVKKIEKEDNLNKINQLLSIYPTVKIPNYFFLNNGNLKFTKNPEQSGLDSPTLSYGAAYADLDNDGDLEIVINNLNQESYIYKNNSIENKYGNYLRIKLVSIKNPQSTLGVKLKIITKDSSHQYYTFNPTKGYLSCHEELTHIGLGRNIDANIVITLVNGESFIIKDIKANQILKIDIDQLKDKYETPTISSINILEDITFKTKVIHRTSENEYTDFKQEPLIPKRFSRLGPCISVGDINGDKLEDIFIGGAKDNSACIYTQLVDGSFKKISINCFEIDKKYEDVNSEIFDFDNDGDNDILVVSGGNEYPNMMEKYPVRLYINNGIGDFNLADKSTMPIINISGKAIAIEDYNHDGYKDVFLGGRVVPGHYGLMPSSYLLNNNNGKFTIDSFFIKNDKLGMITDAKWIDLNKNGYKNLFIVGDWMSPIIISNVNGKLSNDLVSINNMNGWWTSISTAFLNTKEPESIILGNFGLNSRYNCSSKNPMIMMVKDFDKNGSTDAIINLSINQVSYPLPVRDNLLDQMPFLKKRFNRYDQYSRVNSSQIFTQEEMKDVKQYETNYMNSVVVFPKNSKDFSIKKLPFEAQFFPIQSAIAEDIDNDGDEDLLLSGNDYSLEIEGGIMDAGKGLVIENKGDKKLEVNTNYNYNLTGDIRVIKRINIKNEKCIIVGKNNDYIQVLKINH